MLWNIDDWGIARSWIKSHNHRIPLEVRFWGKVSKTSTCWNWIGGADPYGRGRIYVEGRLMPASHVVYIMAYKRIPHGKYILHTCDNPACVRPSHLFPGTQRDNIRDMISKGRAPHPSKPRIAHIKHAQHRRNKLQPNQVYEIRELGQTTSQCKLANQFNVSASTISYIIRLKRWRHLNP